MDQSLDIEVKCLGRVLEGIGEIRSTIEDSQFESIMEALEQSLVEIDEPDCSACIDGRCVKCLRSGDPGKNRPRKAGASLSTFAAMGMSDRLFVESLEDSTEDAEDVYEVVDELQRYLDNKLGAHEECGAANGFITHTQSVSELEAGNQTVVLVKNIISEEVHDRSIEFLDQYVDSLIRNSVDQAGLFARVLEIRGWDGRDFVEHVARKHPEGVEVLHTKDDVLGGHAEQLVVGIDGKVDDDGRPLHTIDKDKFKELTGLEAFFVNIDELRRDASKLGGTPKQKAQMFAASLLYHFGGAYKNLGDGSHPLFIVQVA